ncbi:MAG: hypothetical protein LBQ31_11040 [Bacteroidales bacterium]|nr:hypothetical protein [Bacteroidales bacterium]
MGVPPPSQSFVRGRAFRCNLFCPPPARPPHCKKGFLLKVASKRGQRTRLRGLCRA